MNMIKIIKYSLTLLSFILVVLPSGSYAISEARTQEVSAATRQEVFAQQAFIAWQKINEARRDPLATAERLGVPSNQVWAVFADDPSLLNSGLPPLALNEQLRASTQRHGEDMFSRVYYSHTSPEGLSPRDRIEGAGYQALNVNETLAALVFSDYVDFTMAVEFMLDTMLRDELTGVPGVPRNIFSRDYTEVGVTFLADAVTLLLGEPYVYMYVLDFAAPLEPRRFLISEYDPENLLVMNFYADGLWHFLPPRQPGLVQSPYPDGGGELAAINDEVKFKVSARVIIYDQGTMDNRYVDLRNVDIFELDTQ